MTISVLKMHFRKLPPKIINYKDFKTFDNKRFMNSLRHTFSEERVDYNKNPNNFYEIYVSVLNNDAPRTRSIFVKITRLS